MFCPKCGSAAQDSAQFCMKCGAALPGTAAPPVTGDSKAGLLALLSFIIPGAGQFANRHIGKGVLMLIGGAIVALTVHPLAWFGAGLWSAFEAHQSAAKPASKSSEGFNASKFATVSFVLVICFVVLYNTFIGVTLESLDLTGIGKIKFSQPQNVAPEKEVESLNTEERTQREHELQTKLNEMQEQLQHISAQQEKASTEHQPAAAFVEVSGNWRNETGASYVLQQNGDWVTLQEISMIYGVPTTTAAGQGRISGRTLELDCNTIMEIPGHLRLQLSPDGRTLSGSFTYINGASIPMTLYR